MTHENCENYRELLAAKALNALAAADSHALDTHLESCADCRSEMSEWEDAAALLAFEAEPLEPAPQVRERILASVRAEDRAGRLVSDRVSADASQGEDNVLAFARPTRKVWTALGSFGTIAATVVFAASIMTLVVLWQKNRTMRRELARLTAEMKQTRKQLDDERAMGELLTSPNAHLAKLTGTNVAPGAHAMLAYDKSGHAMLMAKGLPTAPEGMAYQLWYIVGKEPMPGKVFTTDPAGNANLSDQLPLPALSNAVFAVTLEPEKGMPTPTGAIYLSS